jgi:hypothetical protein
MMRSFRLTVAAVLVVLSSCAPPKMTGSPLSITTVDAGCLVTVETWANAGAEHVPVGSTIAWESNPPSNGPHFPSWAAYQEYTTPVPRGYIVHNLEHGAVVLLFNCALVDSAGCASIQGALREASASLPDDPLCSGGVRVRTVMSPDPELSTPIVAVAWGTIYRAACVDGPSLNAFAAATYAKAPENVCTNGVTRF